MRKTQYLFGIEVYDPSGCDTKRMTVKAPDKQAAIDKAMKKTGYFVLKDAHFLGMF